MVTGITTLIFWIFNSMLMQFSRAPHIIQALCKFLFYSNLILWLNSVFLLRARADGVDTETGYFQNRQVKFTLWIFTILIVMEIPMWIFSVSIR